jgi:transposase
VSAPPANEELLSELKSHLPAELLSAVDKKLQHLAYAELKIQALEAALRAERIKKYGPKSDTLPSAQLNLLEAEPGVSAEEIAAEAGREPIDKVERKASDKKKQHPGRQQLPASLPRIERVIACTVEQCICSACGADTAVIGYDESEQLDEEPAKYFVNLTRREKRACKHCVASTVEAAPLPEQIIPKSLVSDRIVIDTVLNKYTAHIPLYRQSALLERDCDITITRATMDGWVMRVGELLMPVAGAMRRELLVGTYIQADETPVAVQMHNGKGNNHQAYLWQYGTPGGSVVFDFRMGRSREGPKLFLDKYEGILQTDGYAAYERVGGPKLIHACCWSHARRLFVDAVKLNPKDAAAMDLVKRIDELFAIDARAREQKLSHHARHELRQLEAAPLLDRLRSALQAALNQCLPASTTAKAIHYTLALWRKLTRFLQFPQLELSTNLAENSMRGIAIGRRNWIHFGHQNAGSKIAAILSVIESCRRLQINPRLYLADILPGLASKSMRSTQTLTPSAWNTAHPA